MLDLIRDKLPLNTADWFCGRHTTKWPISQGGDKQLHWDCSWFWKMWNLVGTASLLPGSTQQWECSHLDGARLFPMSPQRWADDAADQIQLTLRAAGCPLLLRLWENTTKKIIEFFFCHFLSVPFPSWVYEQLRWADLSTAARFCWPSPPTEGWRPSSWRGPCLPCGSPRSPSCSFLRACAAAPSWPSTSRTPLRTPALCHLNK